MAQDSNVKRRDGVQGAVELGPRSLALLRRMVQLLEQIADSDAPDPGKATEDDSVTWPE